MKKTYLIILLFLCLLCINGCKNKEKVYPTEIEDKEIFDMPEEHYYVFIVKDGCSKCEATLPTIVEYLTDYDDNDKYPKIYSVNVGKKVDDVVQKSIISRKFELLTGQGPDKDNYVDGTTSYLQLFIAGTPTLIEIYMNNDQKTARYVAEGRADIIAYFEDLEQGK